MWGSASEPEWEVTLGRDSGTSSAQASDWRWGEMSAAASVAARERGSVLESQSELESGLVRAQPSAGIWDVGSEVGCMVGKVAGWRASPGGHPETEKGTGTNAQPPNSHALVLVQ